MLKVLTRSLLAGAVDTNSLSTSGAQSFTEFEPTMWPTQQV